MFIIASHGPHAIPSLCLQSSLHLPPTNLRESALLVLPLTLWTDLKNILTSQILSPMYKCEAEHCTYRRASLRTLHLRSIRCRSPSVGERVDVGPFRTIGTVCKNHGVKLFSDTLHCPQHRFYINQFYWDRSVHTMV